MARVRELKRLLTMRETKMPAKSGRTAAASPGMAVDSICGMEVEQASALSADKDGETFYFCSAGCRAKFQSQSCMPKSMTRTTAAIPTLRPPRQPWPKNPTLPAAAARTAGRP